MANERKTENIVRDDLRRLGYYDKENTNRIEEQKSEIEAVKRLLKTASKTGKGGHGAPEFIISDQYDANNALLIRGVRQQEIFLA